jgi:citrate lyase subunit beta/citryl-CoA lyase
MRSKLFVTGSRPEFFSKALASEADALSFDLEDAVAESRKGEARATVGDFLASSAAHRSGKTLIVRVNPADSPHFEADLHAVVRQGLHLVNLPKVETLEQVRQARAAMDSACQANQVQTPPRLLLNIESPRGLRCVLALASADPAVAGLQLGFGDLFEPLGISRSDTRAVHACMLAVRLAAAEAGVFVLDSAFTNIGDSDGYLAEAKMARDLGYIGKSCIHPRQVALANQVFRPSADDIEQARRVLSAARDAAREGLAAFQIGGRMIDGPFIDRAETILAEARRHGLIGADA